MLCRRRGCGAGSRVWGNTGRELRVRGGGFYGGEMSLNHPLRFHYGGFLRRGGGCGCK